VLPYQRSAVWLALFKGDHQAPTVGGYAFCPYAA